MRTRIISLVMSMMMVLILQAGVVQAGEVTADVNADVSILTDYVWRGQTYAEGGVIQPNFSIGFDYGLSLGVWANYAIDDNTRYAISDGSQVNEVDYTLDYSFDAGPLGISVGYILYDFPRTGGVSTAEVYAGASLDVILAPTLTVYRDVDVVDGTYVSFGIGHDLELNDKATLSLGATLGWGNEAYHNGYFGVKDSSLSDYSLSASVSYALSDKISVTPSISYSAFSFADSQIEDAAGTNYYEDSNIFGGVNVSYSF